MVVTFYNVSEDPKKVNKTLGGAIGAKSGELHAKTNNLKLSIKLPGTVYNVVKQSNYVFIDTFTKYYYLESYDIENNCIIINLNQDVLMSYKTQIREITATIARNENDYNGYLKDVNYNAVAYEGVQYKHFPYAMDDISCILVTVG